MTPARSRMMASIAGAAGMIALLTLLARAAGFARILVFADTVRAGGVGEIYQSVNALPNVLFEIAAGGVLAAVAVPLIAHHLGAGQRAVADRLASALLSWALVILVPLAVLLFAAAPMLVRLLPAFDPDAHEVAVRLLRIFSVQVPLYGIGIIVTGVLQAHRRFLGAALAPLCSSVVVLGSYLWYASLTQGATAPSVVSDQAIAVLGWGTTLGVVALSLPLLIPAARTGWRFRPTLTFPDGTLRRIGGLAAAGLVALIAQQITVLVTMYLANHANARGSFPAYQYVQAVYLLPYAVLAVPVAVSAFPALAERTGAGDNVAPTVRRALRAVLILSGLAAAVLVGAAPGIGAFFTALDARRGADGASPQALDALPVALLAYGPGLIGFGAIAVLTRALYVKGRPMAAGLSVAAGWLVAALGPLIVVGSDSSPATALRSLGAFSTLGMTLSALALGMLVRRSWGVEATQGLGRTSAVLVFAVVGAVFVADLFTHDWRARGIGEGMVLGVCGGLAGLVTALIVVGIGDRRQIKHVLARGRSARRGAKTS